MNHGQVIVTDDSLSIKNMLSINQFMRGLNNNIFQSDYKWYNQIKEDYKNILKKVFGVVVKYLF